MRNRTFKRQLGTFAASFFLTACVIVFAVSGILIEKNTGKMLGKSVQTPFAVDFNEDNVTLTVSDRDYRVSVEKINRAVKSKSGALLRVILLVL